MGTTRALSMADTRRAREKDVVVDLAEERLWAPVPTASAREVPSALAGAREGRPWFLRQPKTCLVLADLVTLSLALLAALGARWLFTPEAITRKEWGFCALGAATLPLWLLS